MTDTDRITALRLARIAVPDSLDDPEAARFIDLVRLGNAVARHDAGHNDLDQEPAEALGFWQDQADRTTTGFTAEQDGALVGAVTMIFAKEDGATTGEFDLLVDPARWGRGVEGALLDAAEREARERDRPIFQTWTLHLPHQDGRRLEPSTGRGSIPADDRQTVFMIDNGFALEQVERNSAFDLHRSFEPVERMLADALSHAGDDYRVVTWSGATPARYLDSFAAVVSRMSTDTPQGGMVIDEEHWDAERVQRRDARLAAQHLFVSVAAVEHVPTGDLVAYNELAIGDDRTAATQQYGTLVLKEHRGRRLGTVIKCANLLRWRELVPDSPRVSTFNAEENRPMLDVNEAVGFVPVSYAGAWKKILS